MKQTAEEITDDEIRHNLKYAELWIEQARRSYFEHKDKTHFKKSIKFASKFINSCRRFREFSNPKK